MDDIAMTRRRFAAGAAALSAAALSCGAADCAASPGGLGVRFLGTGAADWTGPDPKRGRRRWASVLLDGRVLVDFTEANADMLPEGVRPEIVFYTHSHGDHYSPRAALALGVRRVYCHESWAEGARAEFAAVAAAKGLAAPEVVPMAFGQAASECGLVLTSLPANHCTDRAGEHCSMYLVEKGATRLLYAVDTGGIPGEAARIVGIDAHVSPGRPITAMIMEATVGRGGFYDFRMFSHSCVEDVYRAVRVLLKTKRYTPPEGRKVYITHMARTLHGTQEEIASSSPAPLAPAYDGLEVVF